MNRILSIGMIALSAILAGGLPASQPVITVDVTGAYEQCGTLIVAYTMEQRDGHYMKPFDGDASRVQIHGTNARYGGGEWIDVASVSGGEGYRRVKNDAYQGTVFDMVRVIYHSAGADYVVSDPRPFPLNEPR